MTNKLASVRPEYLADRLLKMNKVSLSLEGKQSTVFAANDKIEGFK